MAIVTFDTLDLYGKVEGCVRIVVASE